MKLLTRHEEHVLLAIMSLRENAYLVTIKEHLQEQTGTDLSFGTLYVSLKRLEKDGYLKHKIGEATSKRGGKAIKYYLLTERGLEALQEVHKVNEAMWVNFSRFPLKK